MKLIDLLEKLGDVDRELTIYIIAGLEWGAESETVVRFDEDGFTKLIVDGVPLEYVLEVYIAQEAIEVWREWHGRDPSPQEKCEAVIHYAKHDSFLA